MDTETFFPAEELVGNLRLRTTWALHPTDEPGDAVIRPFSQRKTGAAGHLELLGMASWPPLQNSPSQAMLLLVTFSFTGLRDLMMQPRQMHILLASIEASHRTHCLLHTQATCLMGGVMAIKFSSITQSCPTLCNPMNSSTPGLPVHHQLPEFTQTHTH